MLPGLKQADIDGARETLTNPDSFLVPHGNGNEVSTQTSDLPLAEPMDVETEATELDQLFGKADANPRPSAPENRADMCSNGIQITLGTESIIPNSSPSHGASRQD